MVNSEHFSQRLQKILEYYDISAATFADAIDVGRSSISHILSGRNKPSLDFVLKIVQAYPEVELYWLLNGKGSFPAAQKSSEENEKITPVPRQAQEKSPEQQENLRESPGNNYGNISSKPGKTIKKVIVLYTDGSFDAYEN